MTKGQRNVALEKSICQINTFDDRTTPISTIKSPSKEKLLISADSRRVTSKKEFILNVLVTFGDICYGRNSMRRVVSLSACDLSALFCPEAPVECSPPIGSVSSVHHDESAATRRCPALATWLSLSLHITQRWHAASLPSQNTRRTC